MNNGWDLKELEASIGGWRERLQKAVAAIEAARPKLSESIGAEEFMGILRNVEEFSAAAQVLSGYGHLRFAFDTRDQKALAFMGEIEQTLSDAQNRILFLELWWKALDEGLAARLMEGAGDIGYYLHLQRLLRRHALKEEEERVINIKDINGIGALGRVYEMITNKFAFELDADGERKTLTRDALMAYVRHPLAAVREAAYREQYRVYEAEATVLGQIYVHRARDWANENLKLRGFPSAIAVRDLSNDVPGEVVDTMLGICREQAGVFHRYFRYKAGALEPESERLRRFDLYAPIGAQQPGENIPYPKAVDMVLKSIGDFSSQMEAHARAIIDAGHVDAALRTGKRGGAFCMSLLPGDPPWVLLNYTGELRQAATLAHELGHGIHSLMAGGHSVLTFHSALPMAETASVFSEMLLTDRLLKEEADPAKKAALLTAMLDDIYATVLRQAFFVIFERDAHRVATEGGTVDELSALYIDNLGQQFGGAVEVDSIFRHEWISIPHIYHAPFYCYAYSFGLLLSLALYQMYKEEGTGFAPRLHRILAHGGASSPASILSEAGIDIADPDFWRSGFRIIEALIDELVAAGGRQEP